MPISLSLFLLPSLVPSLPFYHQERYVIKDIIGLPSEKDLGVENLKGSGTIAGETSLAYNDIFTLTVGRRGGGGGGGEEEGGREGVRIRSETAVEGVL
jgi:acetyl-CoA carboxylase/biotin carboxylase 1